MRGADKEIRAEFGKIRRAYGPKPYELVCMEAGERAGKREKYGGNVLARPKAERRKGAAR